VVDDEVTGLLVPVRDAGALTEAIQILGKDPALRSTMGKAAVERALDEFDERRVVQLVLDTYRQVAARKKRTDLVAELSAG
jgi:glycosyltransferase involved in cell wall biosynthesis